MYQKKILVTGLYNGPGSFGGVTNFTKLLMKNLISNRFTLSYFSIGKSPRWYKGPDSITKFTFFLNHFPKLIHFSKMLKNNNVSMVHVNTGFTRFSILRDGLFSLITYILGYPVFVFFHGWKQSEFNKIKSSKFSRLLFLFIINLHFKIGVLSSRFKEELIDLGIDSEKIQVFSTMVECDRFKKNKHTKGKKEVTFLFCAHPLLKGKGIFEFLLSVPIISNRFKNSKFVVMGGGSHLKHLVKFANEISGNSHITFTGYLSGKEKLDVFHDSDVLIFPSYSEGFPTTVIEAMASGLAIVTTKVGGLIDFFVNGKNGYFLEYNPPKTTEIRDKVSDLLISKKKLNDIKKNNVNSALENFDVKIVCNQLKKIYSSPSDTY